MIGLVVCVAFGSVHRIPNVDPHGSRGHVALHGCGTVEAGGTPWNDAGGGRWPQARPAR